MIAPKEDDGPAGAGGVVDRAHACVWSTTPLVYLPYGPERAHLLAPLASPNLLNAALCGVLPDWPDSWWGTGRQDEYDRAASLPLCAGCAEEREARHKAECDVHHMGWCYIQT